MKKFLCITCFIFLLIALVSGAAITTISTFNNIGIELASTQVETIKVQYKESSASTFAPGHFLTKIDANNHAGSVFMVKSGTSYDIKLTLNTGDTIITASTRSDIFPTAAGAVYHVAPTGNDAYSGTSIATAFKTIGKAVSVAQAGNTVLIHNGVYREEITLPRSGNATAPIIIRNAPGEHPIMDGRDTVLFTNFTVYDAAKSIFSCPTTHTECRTIFYRGNHVYAYYSAWFSNAQAAFNEMIANPYDAPYYGTINAGNFYIRCPNGAVPTASDSICLPIRSTAIVCSQSYIQLIGLEICYYAQDQYSCAIMLNPGSYNVIDSCYFHHNIVGVQMKGACNFNTIQHLKNRESNLDEFSWSSIKEGNHDYEAGAVYIMNSNGGSEPNIGNVIRFNDFEHQFDCAHLFSSGINGATRNMDFHDNICWYSGDDGIETDGYGVNVRIYNNHFKYGLTGISIAPTGYGPVYIFRNIISDWNSHDQYTGYPLKMNYGGDYIYNVFFYHNTCVTSYPNQPALWFKIESQIFDKFTSKNNIYSGTTGYPGIRNDVLAASHVSMDYDDIYTSDPTYIQWVGNTYSTISAFSAATGLEAHGLNKVKPDFLDATNNDYRLIATSSLIDKGVIIHGINDNFTGAAPDIGRYEQGDILGIKIREKQNPILFDFNSYPNPFSANTIIHLKGLWRNSSATSDNAVLRIYNNSGKLIYSKNLKNEDELINWDAKNRCSGTYLATLNTQGMVYTNKMILMK